MNAEPKVEIIRDVTMNSRRRFLFLTVVPACLVPLLVLSAKGTGSPVTDHMAAQVQDAANVTQTPFVYPSYHCQSCHNQPVAGGVYPESARERMICRMTEAEALQHDKHPLALKALVSERGHRMAKQLGYQSAVEINACVACHMTPRPDLVADSFPGETDAPRVEGLHSLALLLDPPGGGGPTSSRGREILDEGISCVACHGATKEWVEQHPIGYLNGQDSQAWNGLSRSEKQARYGMIDLWDPAIRTETCASCHVGDHTSGKVLTHAMYVAGHPPLPSFEPLTYGEAEPRHWQLLSEKTDRQKQRLQVITPVTTERTQLVAIGALMALDSAIQLFVAEASASASVATGDSWPDFARYDCSACHHELQRDETGSWRQNRQIGLAPGRPLPVFWPNVLARPSYLLAIQGVDSNVKSPLDEMLHEFLKKTTAQPFGNSSQLRELGLKISTELRTAIAKLKDRALSFPEIQKFEEMIMVEARSQVRDYDSARQIAWALLAIAPEASAPSSPEKIEAKRVILANSVQLDLPPAQSRSLIEDSLKTRLRAGSSYNPALFQEAIEKLSILQTRQN